MKNKYIFWLKDRAGRQGYSILALAAIGGLLQSGVVVVINSALANQSEDGLNFQHFLLFALCMAGYIFSVRYATSRTINLAGEIIYNTQQRLVAKLRDTSFQVFETTERARIYKNLIESTDLMFETARLLAAAASGLAMLIGSSIYIATMSLEAIIIIVVLIGLGVYIFQQIQKKVAQNLVASKEEEAEFLSKFNDLVDGFAEVKMSRARGDDLLHNYLGPKSTQAKTSRLLTENFITNQMIFAQSFFFAMVGSMVFLVPQISSDGSTVTQIAPVVLFILGPVGSLIAVVPLLAKSDYALGAISELEAHLDAHNDAGETDPASPLAGERVLSQLDLKGIIFRYPNNSNNNGSTFQLGPLDLEIEPGKIQFLVGGNGTGKSTLLKIIAGLYYPLAGSIQVNGNLLGPESYAHYRAMFSLILSDFHIFERLYGMPSVPGERVEEILQQFRLPENLKFTGGAFSRTDLSTGQKKRMALLTVMVEDKPIMLLDEVAADLDPEFRQYFYEELLPGFKKEGKTIIAVSHDDRYFHLADRVIKMDFGQLIGD